LGNLPEGKVQGVPPKEKVPKSINVRKRQFVATSERQSIGGQ